MDFFKRDVVGISIVEGSARDEWVAERARAKEW